MLSRLLASRPLWLIDTLIGILVCACGATLLSLLFRHSALRPMLPLLFIVVIVLAAIRYGIVAGTIGAFVATVVFAYFLFTPIGSLHVERPESRTSLAWMLMIGVPTGYFAWATKLDANTKR